MVRCVVADHGAMNSWDRTAYISDVKYGTPSYEAQMNSVDHNFSAPHSALQPSHGMCLVFECVADLWLLSALEPSRGVDWSCARMRG